MKAEQVVASLLNSATAVTAVVGQRIFGNVAPEQSAAPLIVYRKLGAQRVDSIDMGALAIVEARVELLIVARSYAELKDLGEKVRLAIAYRRGTIAGIDVIDTGVDDEGPDDDDPDLREHGQSWVYMVRHSE